MKDVILTYSCYTKDGKRIKSVGGSGSVYLPEFLDWRSIESKEIYLRRMGGFPPEAHYMLITSQGENRLAIDMTGSNVPQTLKEHKEKENGIESWVQNECAARGVNFGRNPRGQ